MEAFGKFVAYVVGLAISIWLYAWAGQALWSWFVEPLGAPAISMSHTYGLIVLVTFVTMLRLKYKKGHDLDSAQGLISSIFVSPMFWLVGYIAHSIMVG